MSKLIDPKDPEKRKTQWKRPQLKVDREKLRADRIAEAKKVMQ